MTEQHSPLEWHAPGRGRWNLEVAHYPHGQTPVYRAVHEPMSREGLRVSLSRYGVGASHLELTHVHDHAYVRLVPLLEAPRPFAGAAPPAAAVWLASRVLPRFRARTRAARESLKIRRWRDDGRAWQSHGKPALEGRCLDLGSEPVQDLETDALADHVARAVSLLADGTRQHFELVPANEIPVGDLILTAAQWGISGEELLAALAGASPASRETASALAPVAEAVAAVGLGERAGCLDDLRRLGADAEEALEEFLRRHGQRSVAGYDVDQPTLVELPGLLLRTIEALAARVSSREREDPCNRWAEGLRLRVPAAERDRFDDLLAEARYAYGLRDDDAGIALQWTTGLLRRALLEAGRRLVISGRIGRAEDIFELHPDELGPVITGRGRDGFAGPHGEIAAELSRRAERRRANVAQPAPAVLGPDEPVPSLTAAPAALQRVSGAMLAYYELSKTNATRVPLMGTGVGERSVRGRARSALSPGELLAALEPGDVLVVPFATPAYNAVLPMVAGLVVEEGGPLSHAALVARELGIPAVIGVADAVGRIPDGSQVCVDPTAGRVTVL